MNLFWDAAMAQLQFQPGLLGHPSLPLSILGSDVDLAEQRLGTSKAPWAEKIWDHRLPSLGSYHDILVGGLKHVLFLPYIGNNHPN